MNKIITQYLLIGLDAGLPFYPSPFEDYVVLSKGQADFVDGLHTASGTLGQFRPYGDIDFYANGGIIQPGCNGGCLLSLICF